MKSVILAIPLIATAAVASAQTRFDANGDGRITRREYIDARELRFTRLDRNGDQYIRSDDLQGLRVSAPVRQQIQQLLSDTDLNRDGAVSRSEFSVTGTPLFDRADANADGFVDGSEVERLRAALAPPRP